jgi:hypothetical protein
MGIMQQQYDFKASPKMYKNHFSLWKMGNKNLKKPGIKQIAHTKVARDAAGKRSVFKIKGRQIDEQNVLRYVKRHVFSTLMDYVRAVSPFGHDDEIVCYTPPYSPPSTTVIQTVDESPPETARNISTEAALRLKHLL